MQCLQDAKELPNMSFSRPTAFPRLNDLKIGLVHSRDLNDNQNRDPRKRSWITKVRAIS